MRRTLCATVLLVSIGSLAVHAQDAPKPKQSASVDIFGGFSYANYELLSVSSSVSSGSSSSSTLSITSPSNVSARLGLYGWNAAISANLMPWFGLVTDFSGVYSNGSTSLTQTLASSLCGLPSTGTCTETIQNVASSPKIHNFLFGPQFAYPHGKLKPFARFLLGGSRRSISISETITLTENGSSGTTSPPETILTSQSSTPGNLFAMAFGGGADYRFRPGLAWRTTVDYLTGEGAGQNHVRVSSGILWQSGK